MSLPIVAALLVAWLLGTLVVAALWPRRPLPPSERGMMLALGLILGLGITSVIFFAASLLFPHPAWPAGLTEATAVIALGIVRLRRRKPPPLVSGPAIPPWTWLQWALAAVLVQALVIGGIVTWRAFCTEPFGGWDGWAIWNLQARFMVRGGTDWPALLATPELSWIHPDYPKLVSASVARLWSWTGAEPASAAGAISIAFAAGLLGLLVAAAHRLRGRTAALQAGLLLASTPFFLSFAPNQHADIPLASLFLAAVALAALGQSWTLAGFCAGLAAWTKNEGLLFATVFALAAGWQAARNGERRAMVRLLAGVIAGLVPVVYLKLALAPSNDLLAVPLGPRLAQILDASRHRMILDVLWRDVRGFGEWRFAPFLAMALPFVAWRRRTQLTGCATLLPIVLAAMVAGYYAVYLLTPQDLTWHLDTSLVRLLLQLWPLVVLGWSLTVPGSDAPAPSSGRSSSRVTPFAFLGANTVAAVALVLVLSGQLAANELATRRSRDGITRITLGDGWHGREHHGRDTWAWSGGRATLDVQTPVSSSPPPLTLRFTLRSLGERTVALRQGGRVLWERTGPDALVPVEITGLSLPPGLATLEFTTIEPPAPESTAPGARPLAFALYNLALE